MWQGRIFLKADLSISDDYKTLYTFDKRDVKSLKELCAQDSDIRTSRDSCDVLNVSSHFRKMPLRFELKVCFKIFSQNVSIFFKKNSWTIGIKDENNR